MNFLSTKLIKTKYLRNKNKNQYLQITFKTYIYNSNQTYSDIEKRYIKEGKINLDLLKILFELKLRILFMQLMSIEDLATYLGDSKRTIYKYIASGDCPPYIKISAKNIKFDRSDVDAWLESKKIMPKEKKGRNQK